MRPRNPLQHAVAAVAEKPKRKGKRKREAKTTKMGKAKSSTKKKTSARRQMVAQLPKKNNTKTASKKDQTENDSIEETDEEPDESSVLLLGLDTAGKTTILYRLKLDEVVTTIPTIGFNVELIQHKKSAMVMFDVGGQKIIRPLWRHYYRNKDALIFVVDSADRERIGEAAEELFKILADDLMEDVAILVYANKMDLPGAMSREEIERGLKLYEETQRKWYLSCHALCACNPCDLHLLILFFKL